MLIAGAGGLVSSALVPLFENVIALKHAALDITDRAAVDDAVSRVHPDIIFNCAVIGVDDCERDPGLAKRINVDGPVLLADAAQQRGAAIVHFSSNYVFDGRPSTREPYTIDDEPLPVNVYGKTKLEGERAVAAICSRAFVVRTSWVYGRGKDNFLGTVASKLRRGERVQAISDTFASTTYAADLALRVREIVERGVHGTYHVVNEGVCSYEMFAREAARLVNVPDEAAEHLIEVVTESDMNRIAPRPPWTPMRCLLSEQLGLPPLRAWREALAAWVTAA